MTATVQLDLIEDASPTKAYLTAAAGQTVTGTPTAGGYTLTLDSTQSWRYTLTTSGLTGIFRVVVHNGDAETIASGYVWIEADAGGIYHAGPDLATLLLRVATATIDGIVDDILVDTDSTIPALLATIDNNVDAILVDTDATIPALLATIDANVDAILVDTDATIIGKLDVIDGIVDAILTDTDTTIPALLATIDANVDAILLDTDVTIPDLLHTTNTLGTASTDSSLYISVGSSKSETVICSRDVSAETLQVVFETTDKTDVATIADGSITKSGVNATFTISSSITQSERILNYSIKTASGEAVASGELHINYKAQADS